MNIEPTLLILLFLAAVALGWMTALSSAFLGGYMVFRTKREGHDPFMQFRSPKGDALNVSDGLSASQQEGQEPEDVGGWESDEGKKLMDNITDKFQSQMGGDLEEKNGKEKR